MSHLPKMLSRIAAAAGMALASFVAAHAQEDPADAYYQSLSSNPEFIQGYRAGHANQAKLLALAPDERYAAYIGVTHAQNPTGSAPCLAEPDTQLYGEAPLLTEHLRNVCFSFQASTVRLLALAMRSSNFAAGLFWAKNH